MMKEPTWWALETEGVKQDVLALIPEHNLPMLEAHREKIVTATASAEKWWRGLLGVVLLGGLAVPIGWAVFPGLSGPIAKAGLLVLMVFAVFNVVFWGFRPPGWFYRLLMPKTPDGLQAVKRACLRFEIWLLWYPWQRVPTLIPLPRTVR